MSQAKVPQSFLERLEKGERDAWRRYWLAAALIPSLPESPAPDGPHPPSDLLAELLEDRRRAARLGTRLLLPGTRHPNTAETFEIVGERLAVSWGGKAPEGWKQFSPWGYPDDGPLYQRSGSIVPLLGNTLDDPASPKELEVHIVLGGVDKLDLVDGTSLDLTEREFRVAGPERDYVLIVNGRSRVRLKTGNETFDLSDAGVDALPGFTIMEQVMTEESKTFRHGNDLEPKAPRADQEVTVRAHAPESYRSSEGLLHFRGDANAGTVPMSLEEGPVAGQITFSGALTSQPPGSVVRYRIEAKHDSRSEFVQDANPAFVYPDLEVPWIRPPLDTFSYRVGPHVVPEWAKDAVIYHLLIDRFAAAEGRELLSEEETPWLGYAGGTIRGLTERLDYIADLGANVVWVSPFFKSQMHVGYDVEDFFDVNPRLGTLGDVRELCHEAHRIGLRLLLDFEPSYIGAQHPFHKKARSSEDSSYRKWFHWHRWPNRPFGWFGSRMLVALDHGHPAVRAHILEATRFWLDVGFDGFRLDSAHGSPLDFWTDFGATVKKHDPDAFTLGEIMAPLETCLDYQGRLNGFLDFEVCNALRELFNENTSDVAKLDRLVTERANLTEFLGASFIENHDMDRFTFVSGEQEDTKLRSVLLLMMALPDIPILYYGTEVGMRQKAKGDIDQTVRPPMEWGAERDEDLRGYVKELISWRKNHLALSRGSYKPLQTGPGYFFERTLANKTVIAGVNPNPNSISFSVMEVGAKVSSFGSGQVSRSGTGIKISLAPYESCLVSSS